MLPSMIEGFVLLGSVGAVALADTFLLFPEKMSQLVIPCLISYAIGTLLGASFLGLIPHALKGVPASSILPTRDACTSEREIIQDSN